MSSQGAALTVYNLNICFQVSFIHQAINTQIYAIIVQRWNCNKITYIEMSNTGDQHNYHV